LAERFYLALVRAVAGIANKPIFPRRPVPDCSYQLGRASCIVSLKMKTDVTHIPGMGLYEFALRVEAIISTHFGRDARLPYKDGVLFLSMAVPEELTNEWVEEATLKVYAYYVNLHKSSVPFQIPGHGPAITLLCVERDYTGITFHAGEPDDTGITVQAECHVEDVEVPHFWDLRGLVGLGPKRNKGGRPRGITMLDKKERDKLMYTLKKGEGPDKRVWTYAELAVEFKLSQETVRDIVREQRSFQKLKDAAELEGE
jgi:hypothetical protein